jgi:murein DD-endopeptidase MepM/ murein hydrolase activator NlpD
LYEAAITAGAPARIVDDLVDMGWDLDFSSALQPGDIFKVIFEEFQQDGKAMKYGQVLAAEIINKGKVFTRFILMNGKESKNGASAGGGPFLRYPLRFTRISSVFTDARLHPILHRLRPHLGVDFAAPTGTPVRVVAGGKVIRAGWSGGFGNCIRIDHPGPFDSFYAHLQRLAKGLKAGATVERGQVIGYVGATGLATGPHLHFALFRDGQYVNPLTTKLPVMEAVTHPPLSPAVAEKKQRLSEQLAALKVERRAITLVRSVSETSLAVFPKTVKSDG